MLTLQDKQALKQRCEALSLHGLELLANHCVRERRPDAAAIVRDIIVQRQRAEMATRVPLVIAGHSRTMAAHEPDKTPGYIAPYWTSERTLAAAKAVGIVGTGGLLVGYVVIPALVALASIVSAALPYIAGVVMGALVLKSAFSGEKKTSVQIQEKQPGTVYNVYIGQGQNVNVNPPAQ